MTAIPINPPFTEHREESVDDLLTELRRYHHPNPWGPLGTFLAVILSFGLFPLLYWAWQWNETAQRDADELSALATWWRGRASTKVAARIDAASADLGPRPFFMIISLAAFALMALAIGAILLNGGSIDRIERLTYGFEHHRFWWTTSPIEINFHALWLIGLIVGYGCQWFSIRSHVWAVDNLVSAINRAANANGVRPVSQFARFSGLSFLWVVLTIGLCGATAWWAIPMVLAGALQRRYAKKIIPTLRQELASQLTEAVSNNKVCRTLRCAAPLAEGANFCPRCGKPVIV